MTRRGFLLSSLLAAEPRVNAARLRARLEKLSEFGRPTGGTFADGVSRTGYSEPDVAARAWVMDLMRAAGLRVRIDAAGNIFARRDGADPAIEPVLFGSHIDSVPNGGNFDGDLGSLAALEVLEALKESGSSTRRPLEAVIWACEEATFNGMSLNGSRAAAGRLVKGELDQVSGGLRKSDGVRRIGGNPDRIEDTRIKPGSFHGYLELHIEQGGVLDQEGTPVGVVEGIVAIDRYAVEIEGFANHAGTTPMAGRQDALIAAARLILAVQEIVTAEAGRQVGTVGQLQVHPNASNVIPGRVSTGFELRDLSGEKLVRLAALIRRRTEEIARDTRTRIRVEQTLHNEPAAAAESMQSVIETAARALGLASRRLPSGAGHDAQMMAQLGPMGMIFVPSVNGVSHSPKELTRWDDCARGAAVLLRSVAALAS